MAVAYVETITDTGSGTTISVDVGDFASLAVGDLILCHIGISGANTISDADGFTEVILTKDAADITSVVLGKIADSADVAGQIYDFVISGSSSWTAKTTQISGNTASVAGIVSNGQVNAASLTVTAPSITPATTDTLILFLVVSELNTNSSSAYAISTDAIGFTEAYDVAAGSSARMALAYGSRVPKTATGIGQATLGTSRENIGQLLSIKPIQDIDVQDTTTVIDSIVYALDSKITDTVSLSDIIDADGNAGEWTLESKPSSTWTLENK